MELLPNAPYSCIDPIDWLMYHDLLVESEKAEDLQLHACKVIAASLARNPDLCPVMIYWDQEDPLVCPWDCEPHWLSNLLRANFGRGPELAWFRPQWRPSSAINSLMFDTVGTPANSNCAEFTAMLDLARESPLWTSLITAPFFETHAQVVNPVRLRWSPRFEGIFNNQEFRRDATPQTQEPRS